MSKPNRYEAKQGSDVSSKGAAEAAVERAKDRRPGTWEEAAKRSPHQIPAWDGESAPGKHSRG